MISNTNNLKEDMIGNMQIIVTTMQIIVKLVDSILNRDHVENIAQLFQF